MTWRRFLLVAAAFVVVAGVVIAKYVHDQLEPTTKRGSATDEFTQREPGTGEASRRRPWPTYAFDRARTHVADDFRHRPPYRRLWSINAHNTLEFPPAIGFGHVYLAQQKGRFYALNPKTGRVKWRKKTRRCSASSPTLGRRFVYQAWMAFVPCPQDQSGATGYLSAMNPRTGKEKWRYKGAPIESSPLLVGHTLYFGSWDKRVHAIDARTGRRRWSFKADDQLNTSPAYWRGGVYIASDGGTLYALGAHSGRLRWRASSNAKFGSREFFYATPTVAYGRVYIGNTDGTMYAYGARTGKLRWARPLGTYVYAAAAAWHRTIYTGTYDGKFYALSAATGDVRWKHHAAGAVHGAPTVMDGLVYYSTCSTCGSAASRSVKRGPDGTFALNARTGHAVWRFRAGKYANPIVADDDRVYLTGRSRLFALTDRAKKGHRAKRHHRAKEHRKKRHHRKKKRHKRRKKRTND
jgi:outer membrane protein assembly factor BamB